MTELVVAVAGYARWLYAILAVLIAIQLATIWRAARERDIALFELERQAASGKAVRAFVTLLLLVTIGAGVYTVASVIAPVLPEDPRRADDPAPIAITPILADIPTATPTSEPVPRTVAPVIITSTPSEPPTPGPSESP